jgi:uncharacterized protein (TIGR03086 family)
MLALSDAVGLLERAIGYCLGSVAAVTPQLLAHPTPCLGWDVRILLRHVNDSLAVLGEGVGAAGVGHVSAPGEVKDPADVVAAFRDGACRVLGDWTTAGPRDHVVPVADRALLASTIAVTGAIEIAVHGWDVSRACGSHRPIPPALALDLLKISRLVVTDATRYPQFAAPVAVSPLADPSDRLVAYLGRNLAG